MIISGRILDISSLSQHPKYRSHRTASMMRVGGTAGNRTHFYNSDTGGIGNRTPMVQEGQETGAIWVLLRIGNRSYLCAIKDRKPESNGTRSLCPQKHPKPPKHP